MKDNKFVSTHSLDSFVFFFFLPSIQRTLILSAWYLRRHLRFECKLVFPFIKNTSKIQMFSWCVHTRAQVKRQAPIQPRGLNFAVKVGTTFCLYIWAAAGGTCLRASLPPSSWPPLCLPDESSSRLSHSRPEKEINQ